jgi:dolichol-phosphate mannosyltransferase
MHDRVSAFPGRHDQATLALSVVVPCFNEQDNLGELHRRLCSVCGDAVAESYEIVLINDGSKDRTWEKIKALTERDPRVAGVNLSRNHGHQLALSAGLSVCRGDRVLIIDADLQDPPELLPDMMRLMDEGADVVYGQREHRDGESWFKTASASLFYRLLDRMGEVKIPVDTGDFRLMSRRALDILNAMPERNRFIRGMVSWIGLEQVPIRYRRQARFAGDTKYPLRNMLSLAADAITSFSTLPLRLASQLGMVLGFLGIFVLLYIFYSWAVGNVIQGWTSVISLVLILGSVQLFVIGILGEYMGRMFIEMKQRPLFIIDEVVRQPRPVSTLQPSVDNPRKTRQENA